MLGFGSFTQMARVKAIFVGINYGSKVNFCKDLKGIPYVHAKSMIEALTTSQDIYKKDECLLFTDSEKKDIHGFKKDKPTKDKVMSALKGMVSTAEKEDALLFYYCGHGANDPNNFRGCITTLKSTLTEPDTIYSNELDELVQNLSKDISVTWLIHACFSGAMFSYRPEKMKGVALTSVGPDIPSVVKRGPGGLFSEDFTTYILNRVIKKFSEEKPTYTEVYDGVKKIIVKGVAPDKKPFKGHAELYCAPGVNPSQAKFLQPY